VRLEDESVMLTGDGNLVELQASLRYVVSDPQTYLFAVNQPEAILRAVVEAELREAVAGQALSSLLTTAREPFQQHVLERIRRHCDRLGIRLDGLSLHDLHPPQAVVEEYHNVARAMEARDRQVNESQAAALRQKRDAQADGLQIERQATASAHELITQTQANQAAFLARQAMRNRLTLTHEIRLLAGVGYAYWSGQKLPLAVRNYVSKRWRLLEAQARLTDFRLYWDALTQTLTGRDKVMIDAEHVPGRLHLWLLDPEQWRVPMPAPFPSPRASPGSRETRGESHGEGP
jgi:hypothetical protein